jgi:Thiopurine S-methyltransferase (TPMT)
MNLASPLVPRSVVPGKVDRPIDWSPGLCTPCSNEPSAWAAFYESRYQQASGDAAKLGWATQQSSPALIEWLNEHASSVIRPGACITVVGCGLGDDVAELTGRGYDAFGFDCAPSAISWAQRRHAEIAGRFLCADLFDPPTTILRRGDLVIDLGTLGAVPPALREAGVSGLVALARGRSRIVVVTPSRASDEPLIGPPFGFCPTELRGLFAAKSWTICDEAGGFRHETRDEAEPAAIRAVFKRN